MNYFDLCETVAKNSKCLSRQVGAVLITPDGTVVGTGYNGPARKVPHCDSEERLAFLVEQLEAVQVGSVKSFFIENGYGARCPRQIMGFKSGEGLEYCTAGHAERNSLINSAREGIRTKGCIMVMSCGVPCSQCAVEIVNAGISKIICLKTPTDYDSGGRWILQKGGVEIEEI